MLWLNVMCVYTSNYNMILIYSLILSLSSFLVFMLMGTCASFIDHNWWKNLVALCEALHDGLCCYLWYSSLLFVCFGCFFLLLSIAFSPSYSLWACCDMCCRSQRTIRLGHCFSFVIVKPPFSFLVANQTWALL